MVIFLFFDIVALMKRLNSLPLLTILLLCLLLITSCSTTKNLENLYRERLSVSEFMEKNGNNSYEATLPVFFNTGDEWNERSLELIKGAKEYILLSTFLGVEHNEIFEVWDALAQKVEEGVRVYVMIDSSSNFQMVPISNERIKAAYMMLDKLGIEFVEYNSLSLSNLFFIPHLLDRDHRKYWVVDGQTVAIGGVNVNHTSIAWPKGVGNIDTMVEFSSSGVIKEVIDTFVDTWNNYSTNRLATEDFTIALDSFSSEEERTSLYLIDHYWPTNSKISSLFDLFSLYAEDELWFIQGYTFLTPSLLSRIKFAINRGVKVNIILSDYSTQPKYEMASRYGALDLLEAGATLYMYSSVDEAFLHAKMIVADKKLVTVGSANYNFRSETLSRELNLLYEDERVAKEVYNYIQELLNHCRIVTLEEAQSYRNIRSWYNYLLMQIWG